MDADFGRHYLEDIRKNFLAQKNLADRALRQLDEPDLFYAPDAESNSIAVIMKHIAGNLRSRWTDFLTTDGEKPDRNREGEFELAPDTTREQLFAWWEDGWRRLFETLDSLKPEDLQRRVLVRGEELSVVQAIHRQLAHKAYHVGQIVYLAKHRRGHAFESLTIPRGQSAAFTAALMRKAQR